MHTLWTIYFTAITIAILVLLAVYLPLRKLCKALDQLIEDLNALIERLKA
jgi:hypothetical protein